MAETLKGKIKSPKLRGSVKASYLVATLSSSTVKLAVQPFTIPPSFIGYVDGVKEDLRSEIAAIELSKEEARNSAAIAYESGNSANEAFNNIVRFPQEATVDLNFIRGKYLVDDGELNEFTDPNLVVGVKGSTMASPFRPTGVLRDVPANILSRAWHLSTGKPLGAEVFTRNVNHALYSRAFNNAAWLKDGLTATASTLTETTATGVHRVVQPISGFITTLNQRGTVSAIVSAQGKRFVRLSIEGPFKVPVAAIFDIEYGHSVSGTGFIHKMVSGEYRIQLSSERSMYAGEFTMVLEFLDDNQAENYVGDGISGITIRDGQCVTGFHPGPIMATQGTVGVRESDTLSLDLTDKVHPTRGSIVLDTPSEEGSINLRSGTTELINSKGAVSCVAWNGDRLQTYFFNEEPTLRKLKTQIDPVIDITANANAYLGRLTGLPYAIDQETAEGLNLSKGDSSLNIVVESQPSGVVESEKLLGSFLKTKGIQPLNTPFDHETKIPSYQDVLDDIDGLVKDFPTKVQKDFMGYSAGGREIFGLRILDDGKRPIVGISNGIHGDERTGHLGIFHVARELLKNNDAANEGIKDPVLAGAYKHLAFFITPMVNVDGMADPTPSSTQFWGNTGKRLNDAGINLNRDWPYYWEVNLEDNSGMEPLSQPETQAFDRWFSEYAGNERVYAWFDIHGWISRDTWGWITEYLHHDEDGLTQSMQSSAYLNFAHVLEKRDWKTKFPNGWMTGTKPVAGQLRSKRKAYLYTYVKNKAHPAAVCGLFEYPQREYPGAHASVTVDVLHGLFVAALDLHSGLMSAERLPRAAIPHNAANNSLLWEWDYESNEPMWHSHSGLRLTKVDSTAEMDSYVKSFRPMRNIWPREIAPGQGFALVYDGIPKDDAIYDEEEETYTNDSDEFVLVGGYNNRWSLVNSHSEGVFTQDKNIYGRLPIGIKNGALSTDQKDLYFFGGYREDYTYSDKIYTAPVRSDADWVVAGTMPEALQRHTVLHWNEGLHVLFGGRSSTGYSDTVYMWDSETNSWAMLGTLPSARGWAAGHIEGDILWVFGGWTGGSTLAEVVKFDMTTGISTQATPLPGSRAESAIAVNGNMAYIIMGRSGSIHKDTILAYDMTAETVSELVYTTGEIEVGLDGRKIPIERPDCISAAAYYHPTKNKLIIVGGEKSTGEVTADILELSLDDNVLRQPPNAERFWGYIRSREVFHGLPGDQFTLVSEFRNANIVGQARNPYVRLTILVGPLSNITRKVRMWYSVPPQEDFRSYSLPFQLLEGESEFRIYNRHYGGNTTVDMRGLQLFKGRPDYVTLADSTGIEARTGTTTPDIELDNTSDSIEHIVGTFSPHAGSNMDVDVEYMQWVMSGDLTDIRLRYTAVFDPLQDTTGYFTLQWTRPDGTTFEETFWEGADLNHRREWRRDCVSWRLQTGRLNARGVRDMTLLFDFYGKTYSKFFGLTEKTICHRVEHREGQTYSTTI